MSAAHRPAGPDCREMFAQLSEYLDGELDPELCSRLERHMGDCPPCQAFLQSLRSTIELTRGLPPPTLPDEIKEELLRAYHELEHKQKK